MGNRSYCWQPGLPVGQHYEVATNAHLTWMLLGRKAINKLQKCTVYFFMLFQSFRGGYIMDYLWVCMYVCVCLGSCVQNSRGIWGLTAWRKGQDVGWGERYESMLWVGSWLEPGGMSEWIERPVPVSADRGIRTLVKSNQWLNNLYLSLPSHAFNIIRIEQGCLIQCYWVGYQLMVLAVWSPSGAALKGCHECALS